MSDPLKNMCLTNFLLSTGFTISIYYLCFIGQVIKCGDKDKGCNSMGLFETMKTSEILSYISSVSSF